MKANLISLAAFLCWLAFMVWRVPQITWTTPKIIGAALITLALPLFVLARLQLGASFAVSAEARTLVTTGLYARFRNPIYLFGGLTLAGVSLFRSVWGPLLVAVVIVPLQVVRVRKEEQVLARAFGDEYERYKRQTWF